MDIDLIDPDGVFHLKAAPGTNAIMAEDNNGMSPEIFMTFCQVFKNICFVMFQHHLNYVVGTSYFCKQTFASKYW